MGLLGMVTRPLVSSTVRGQPVVGSTMRARRAGDGGWGLGVREGDGRSDIPHPAQADTVESATTSRSSRYVSEADRTPDPWLLRNEHDWQCSQLLRMSCSAKRSIRTLE